MVLTRKRAAAADTKNEKASSNSKIHKGKESKRVVSKLLHATSKATSVSKIRKNPSRVASSQNGDTSKTTSPYFKSAVKTIESDGNASLIHPQPCTSASVDENANENIDSSDSEIDWDEVPEIPDEPSLDDYNPIIPEDGIEVTVSTENLNKDRRKRKKFDFALYARRQLNRFKKDVQIELHKVHLLCWIAHGFYLNRVLNTEIIRGLAFSLITEKFMEKRSSVTILFLEKLLKHFASMFSLQLVSETDIKTELKINNLMKDLENDLTVCFVERKTSSVRDYCLVFISLARALNLDVRLCLAAYPISYKPTDLIKTKKEATKGVENGVDKSKSKKSNESLKLEKSTEKPSTSKAKNSKTELNLTNNTQTQPNLKKNAKAKRNSAKKVNYNEQDEDSDRASKRNVKKPKLDIPSDSSETDSDDFALKPRKVSRLKNIPARRKSVKILSSESSEDVEVENRNSVDYWVEIYSPLEKKWICVDVANGNIDKPNEIERNLLRHTSYMIGIDEKFCIRDITKKYASNWLTFSQKQRVDSDWWEDTMEIYRATDDKRYFEEEKRIQAELMDKPLPKSVGEFKNHPLYALKRHLLKFEGIYPPDAPSLGFIRSEPIYARECVHTLHSRETWMKQARVVKRGELPYKVVKARPKWDKMSGEFKTDLPLEIFGRWQTEDYVPPPAKDGKVPRNEYGNIELFQSSMLPAGTVHLQLPGLNRIARKLGLDCAPALVGFDSHGGGAHPVFDGFVVCSEFKEVLLAAWDEEQENIRKREEEKREKRVYDNWKKLIKGLLIREKIKLKYGDPDK